jgi:hypothetical protein
MMRAYAHQIKEQSMSRMLRIFEVALLVLFLAGSARADLKMASLFQDHMVLQRDKPEWHGIKPLSGSVTDAAPRRIHGVVC